MPPLCIAVTGTRAVPDPAPESVRAALADHLLPFCGPDTTWLLGGAAGIDTLALTWLAERAERGRLVVAVPVTVNAQPAVAAAAVEAARMAGRLAEVVELVHPDGLGPAAYTARNRWLVDSADLVIGFPLEPADDGSGTWETLHYARASRRPVVVAALAEAGYRPPPELDRTPRVPPVEPPYDAVTAEALDRLGPPLALFRVLARRPDRALGVHGWGRYYLSRQSALSLRQRELVIHRTTARCGADYEWGVHVAVFADKAGFDAAQLVSLATGRPDDPCWEEPDRAVIAAVDALHERHDLSDAEWERVVPATGMEGAADLLLLCGWYHAISYAVRALRLPLEPNTRPLPAPGGPVSP